MTFLNPAILWGLIAAVIPIIIHIFNLKKTKKLEFSTLMFLKEIQQTRYKKIKLKQLLLLICRILIIVLLVMMFAKPIITLDTPIVGEDIRSTILIVLDNSFSLESRSQNKTQLEIAKQKAEELINELDKKSEILFITTSEIKNTENVIREPNVEKLKEFINGVNYSPISIELNEVLLYSKQILISAMYDFKEIYYITDGQRTYIERENYPNLGNELEGIKTNIILVSQLSPSNISIDSIDIVSKVYQKNKPIKIKALINNHNNYNVQNVNVILSSGSVRQEEILDLNSNSITEKEFTFKPELYEYNWGSIEIILNSLTDDEIYLDNKQYFSLYIPKEIKVLIINNNTEDSKYIKVALKTSQEGGENYITEPIIKFDELNTTTISSIKLNDYNCIIITSKNQFTTDEIIKITEYINNGGGLIIYGSKDMNINSYNEMFSELGYKLIEGKVNYSGASVFETFDYEHPIIEGIFKTNGTNKKSKPNSPIIKELVLIKGGANTISAISFPDGYNFLTEFTGRKGRVLLYSVSSDMSSSDFPTNNLFLPLTYRSVLYCSDLNEINSFIAGKGYIYFGNKQGNGYDSLKIINADNAKIENIKFANFENIYFPIYNLTHKSGNFISKIEDKEINILSINFDKKETSTSRINKSELNEIMKNNYRYKVNIIEANDNIKEAVIESREGKQLWKLFLILVIGFVIVEYFISKSLNKTSKI